MTDVTVVIPTIPPRADRLARALASVESQTLQPAEVIVVTDDEAKGAGWTRTEGLMKVTSEWTAFLDDDDELLPCHLQRLHETAAETGADMVFPWFTVVGGTDPFPMHFGRTWDINEPTQTTITFLVRTSLAQQAGGFLEANHLDGDVIYPNEDFRFVLRLAANGAKIVHLPERTWLWNHHGGNLSGRSWKQFQ
jgi:glycosyltransferase involved in cell wall biosynthesis